MKIMQSLSPLILFLVIGIQYPIMVIRFSLCFLWSVHSVLGGRKHSISVQPFSPVLLFATPCTAHQALLSITNTWVLFRFMSIELVMPFNHLIWLWLLGVWGCAAGPLCLSQDMTHTEYAMAICYWPSVYRQFNGKLNVVLTMYSLLIQTISVVAWTYGILKAEGAKFDSPPRSINFRKRTLWDCLRPVCLQHGNRQEPSTPAHKSSQFQVCTLQRVALYLLFASLVCIMMVHVYQGSPLSHICTVAIIIQSNINRGQGNTACYLVSKIILITCLQLLLHQYIFVHSC